MFVKIDHRERNSKCKIVPIHFFSVSEFMWIVWKYFLIPDRTKNEQNAPLWNLRHISARWHFLLISFWCIIKEFVYYFLNQSNGLLMRLHTVSFDWFLSSLEWILDFEFCLLKLLIFYQKVLWNIRSRLNSSTFWVFEPAFKYVWSKS